jgi:hypothetical protein
MAAKLGTERKAREEEGGRPGREREREEGGAASRCGSRRSFSAPPLGSRRWHRAALGQATQQLLCLNEVAKSPLALQVFQGKNKTEHFFV